ncbi:CidA/LrgA family protein [Jutongia hominis]|jgi:holin-like protein|uniref:CidA/LrgA family protein n=1 Tax=Jutongia hominis TaxID=2763664 RepID=A0ABR7MRI0_9FIRM|nr:CidA/LrgA family protein [Jutongia hominis]MBC8556406.1 CidA/LrgA family protein [Jutongia hominis]
MKYVRQFVIIMLFTFLGEVLKALLPFPVPASIYGLLALLIALETKLLPLASVRDVGEFFVEIMPLTFIPAGVGLLESWGVMKPMLGSLVLTVVVSTILVMAVSGLVTQGVIALRKRRNMDEV